MATKNKPIVDEPKTSQKFIVIERFADKDNKSIIYEKDVDVSHFDTERLVSLVNRKLVKVV